MAAKTILVFSEKLAVMQELLGQARQQADDLGWSVSALASAEDAAALGEFGADVVYKVAGNINNPETATDFLAEAVHQAQPTIVLVGATKLGLEVAPRLAERQGLGYAAWTIGFEVSGETVTAQTMLYTGTGLGNFGFKPGTAILSVAPGVFEAQATSGKTASVLPLDVPVRAPHVTVMEEKPKPVSGVRIESAKLVVDVGQGVKQREDLQLIQSVADLLDGQVGCSRPVASDRDWFPEWLGLSGAKIKPELCLTVGVSGAIQHIVGIRESHLIAAINSDEGAPIFMQADYGVVADLYEFLPAFVERLKARGVRPAWK
jgi:electron transfer flavoprotein alpha subunit